MNPELERLARALAAEQADARGLGKDLNPEVTKLTPAEEARFWSWVRSAGITDVDAPQSFYDYRGYWKDIVSKGQDRTKMYADGLHFPDTYKQHGHPTFSVESKYSRGRHDGGRWGGPDGETFIPAVNPELVKLARELAREQAEAKRLGKELNPEWIEHFARERSGGQFSAADVQGVLAKNAPRPKDTSATHPYARFGDAIKSLFSRHGAEAMGQGAMFGFGDEIEGLVHGPAAKEEMRLRSDLYRQERPMTAGAAELLGGVAVPGAGAVKLAKGATTVPRAVAKGIGFGGGAGALAGAGHGEGFEGRAGGAALGGGAGAILGGVVPVAPAVTRLFSPTVRATRRVVRAVEESGGKSNVLNRAVRADALGRGDETVLADLSDALRDQAESVAASSSKARNTIRDFTTERQARTSERLLKDAIEVGRDEFGDVPNMSARARNLKTTRRDWAKGPTGYGGLRESQVGTMVPDIHTGRVTPAPEGVAETRADRLLPAKATNAGRLDDMVAMMRDYDDAVRRGEQVGSWNDYYAKHGPSRGFTPPTPSTVTMPPPSAAPNFTRVTEGGQEILSLLNQPRVASAIKEAKRTQLIGRLPVKKAQITFQELQDTKEALDDAVSAAFRGGKGNLGTRLGEARDMLVEQMEKRIPNYRKVAAEYRWRKGLESSLEKGYKAWGADDVDAMSQTIADIQEKGGDEWMHEFRRGLAARYLNKLRTAGSRQGFSKRVIEGLSNAEKAKIRIAFGSEANFRTLMQRAQLEKEMARLARIGRGSTRSARLASDAADDILAPTTTGLSAGLHLAASAIGRGAGRLARATGGEATANKMLPMLMARGTDNIDELLRNLRMPYLTGSGASAALPIVGGQAAAGLLGGR